MLIALKLINPGSKVLSIGCGGREVRYFVKESKCDVTGIDYDSEMIERSGAIEPCAEYLCQDALNFSREKHYDYVVCLWNTINFLPKRDRKKLVELAYKNLGKKGKFILTSPHVFQHWRLPLHNLKHKTGYYYFPSQINWWFKDTKFKVEKIKVQHCNLIVATKRESL